MTFHLYDVVTLKRSIPERGLDVGAKGAIVLVHDRPRRAYEVEMLDALGSPDEVLTVTLEEEDIEKAQDASR